MAQVARLVGGDRAIRFIESMLVHTKGPSAGQPFILHPWQQDILRDLLKVRPDGLRQHRKALIGLPRKQGKTQMIAALALYFLLLDTEPGGEIYACAGDRDQARRIFEAAKEMLLASPLLAGECDVLRDSIHQRPSGSIFRVLSADAVTKHGLNPSVVLFDELHVQPNRELWSVMTTAQAARLQPLVIAITTAGHDRQSICYELYRYGCAVRDGYVVDPSFYFYWLGADEQDDWTDRAVWRRVMPALGSFAFEEHIEEEFRQALELPGRQNVFRQLYLNQWTEQASRWIDMTVWGENAGHAIDEQAFGGRACWGGLDLASTSDLTALVWLFRCEDDPEAYDVLCRFWVPEAQVERGRNAHLYRQWTRSGHLLTTPGAVTNYGHVREQILKDAARFAVLALNVDRLFQAAQLSVELADEGLPVTGMGQGFTSMAAPTVAFERKLLERRLHHGNHPALTWQAGNVVVRRDPAGNLKIDKEKSQEKVDGLVAMVMALDGATRVPAAPAAPMVSWI